MEHGEELNRLGDADLVSRARAGEDGAYAELFRRHQPAATALARTLTDRAAADDVVAEAFEKLLLRIRAGGGPQSAFRPYLLQTVRTVAVDSSRRVRRLVVADNPEATAQPDAPPEDSLFDTVYERTTLARAFGALPDRWQTVLWLSFVEEADRQEIATILGINVGGVSALGYRAREGLRRAYLDAHLVGAPTTTCAEVWPLLSGAVRGGLTPGQSKKVDGHVAECHYCAGAVTELDSVNARLGMVLAPLVLGAAAPAYLHLIGQAHGAAAASGSLGTIGSGAGGAGGVGVKASIVGLLKGGAASMAVVASTSTVAIVAMIAVFSAPLAKEPSADAGPDHVISDVARQPGSQPTSNNVADPMRSTDAAGDPTNPGDPTTSATAGEPTVSTGPTGPTGPTGLPTSGPTSGPTSAPTSGQPTGGPTTVPTGHPTSGGPTSTPTATGGPTTAPTADSTPTATPTGVTPTSSDTVPPSQNPQVQGVAASVGNVGLTPRPDTPGLPMRVDVPVSLTGGSAGLQVMVNVAGMTNFATVTTAWTCTSTTPMAGNNPDKIVRLQCLLPDATPGGALDLGLNINYVGDNAQLNASLSVQSPDVDTSQGDDSATTALPPRQ
ncbi:MAG: sigma-70 family RNA polymerase sigma factor [Nocardioides sp.]